MFYASIQANLDSKPLLIEKCTYKSLFQIIVQILGLLFGIFGGDILFNEWDELLFDEFIFKQFVL